MNTKYEAQKHRIEKYEQLLKENQNLPKTDSLKKAAKSKKKHKGSIKLQKIEDNTEVLIEDETNNDNNEIYEESRRSSEYYYLNDYPVCEKPDFAMNLQTISGESIYISLIKW